MAFIKEANKADAGRRMKNIYDQIVASINNISQQKEALEQFIGAMKNNNVDYTEEDWKELQEFVDDIKAKIAEL